MIIEGLIKLPSVRAEIANYTLALYFAHVGHEIERRFKYDDEELVRAQRILESFQQKYHVTPTAEQRKLVKEQTVFTKLFKIKEELYGEPLDLTVRFRLLFEKQQRMGSDHGVYYDDTVFIVISPYNMKMTGPSLRTVAAVRASLHKCDDLLAYIDHELTHLVQFRSLGNKHPSQVHQDYAKDDGEEEGYTAAYVGSQLEFDPLLKTAQGKYKRLINKYKLMPGFNRAELLAAFTASAPKPEWMAEHDVSLFFKIMKSHSYTKWKKAVKLFIASH